MGTRYNSLYIIHCTKLILLLTVSICAGQSVDEYSPDDNMFKHHNYKDMVAFMDEILEKCPQITRKYSVGKSVLGRDLWVLEISDNPGNYEPLEPNLKYIGNMHGNEVVGREMLLYLLDYLCEGYKRGIPEVEQLVDNIRIHILPSMNPDGYEEAKEGDCSGVVGRGNHNKVDLNRNFPDQYAARKEPLQPETKAIMEWLTQYPFVLSSNFHGGSLVANYPFDDDKEQVEKYSLSPDDDIFRHIASIYAEHHPQMYLGKPNCYPGDPDRFPGGITNGANWYSVAGGMQDYNYLTANCFEITVEMACCKFPKANKLKSLWKDHQRSLIEFMKQVNVGLKGFVRYSNGTAIENATVVVEGRKHVAKTSKHGEYYRLLLPGNYNVKASALDLELKVAVEVRDGAPLQLNFAVSGETITGQLIRPMRESENEVREDMSAYVAKEQSNNQKSLSMSSAGVRPYKKRVLSDNAIAAIVIITLGFIVCIIAGVILYRRLRELREVEEGYRRIDEEKDEDFP